MSASVSKNTLRILLVENHEDTRKYLTMFLSRLGHEVTTASSMQEGLQRAENSDCNVLISDIGLSDGDGWELLERANFQQPVYAIAMSGYGMKKDQDRSAQVGYRHHLLKPVAIEQLKKALALAEKEVGNPTP